MAEHEDALDEARRDSAAPEFERRRSAAIGAWLIWGRSREGEAVRILARLLNDPDFRVRQAAAERCRKEPELAEAVFDELLGLLGSHGRFLGEVEALMGAEVRDFAARAMADPGRRGGWEHPAFATQFELLCTLLGHSAITDAARAILQMRPTGERGRRAGEALRRALAQEPQDYTASIWMWSALGALEPRAPDVVERLVRLLRSRKSADAVLALGQIRDMHDVAPPVVEAMRRHLSPKSKNSDAALFAVSGAGRALAALAPEVEALLLDSRGVPNEPAVRALAALRVPISGAAIPTMVAQLRHGPYELREAWREDPHALGQAFVAEARRRLRAAIDDPGTDIKIREWAATGLAALGEFDAAILAGLRLAMARPPREWDPRPGMRGELDVMAWGLDFLATRGNEAREALTEIKFMESRKGVPDWFLEKLQAARKALEG